MTTICTLSVSPLCGFAGRYLRFCPKISPSLSADIDISVLVRRYLRPSPEISPFVGFHAPINSANEYALYEVSVRQTRYLPPASFRFQLAMDTLAFGCMIPAIRAHWGVVPVIMPNIQSSRRKTK